MAPYLNIAIIGGGITGPALAIFLNNYGLRCVVYESRASDYEIGGSMVVAANGIRVLDHLGVFEQVQALGFVHEYGTLVNIKGDPIGKLVLGSKERYDYPAVRLYRNSLRQVLLAEASRQGIEIRYDMRCIKVHNETNDSVTVKFANGELITADLVIGTDGMNSQVREYIAPNVDPAFTGQAAVIAFAEKSELRDLEKIHDTKMILGTEGSFAIMPADGAGDEIMFFSTIETHERTKEEWQEFNTNKRALKDVLQNPFSNENWPHIVRFLIKETPAETFFCWPFHTLSSLEHFVSPLGRVIIAGDAAHAMPPSVGQGGSMSLEDAETLARTISSMNTRQNMTLASGRELLTQWEAHRRSRTEKVIERTKMGSIMRKASGSEAAQAEKEENLQAQRTEDDLHWLYGYDGMSFETILGDEKGIVGGQSR